MISTTLGMTKTLYQSTISSLRLQKIPTAMGIPVMSMGSLDPPFPQVAPLHPLIPPIVTRFFVFFMTQPKPLETTWVLMKTNRQFHRPHPLHNRRCHRCRPPHPNLPWPQRRANSLVSALLTKTRTGTMWHLRLELIRMESVHTVSYRYTTRRTWTFHYRQSVYQTKNREVVVQAW